ncbi:MAG: VOC family protein [Chloroflexia bacterium]|nr:VOC family protein [Chloroflexia bacterium]MBA3639878.1 VOC family protein [Acidobacteriota bacterium]
MSVTCALRDIAQVNMSADDLGEARDWYARFLGVEPYFQRPGADNPAYVEFRLGDYKHELGIIDCTYLPPAAQAYPGGAVVRWHVDDLPATMKRLKELGAQENEPKTEREEGFVTDSMIFPLGNILGLMHSPHYLQSLANGAKRS